MEGMAKRPLEIDMCSSSQLRDTQGEMLNVEGADISELAAGRGRLNDNHGKGFFNCLGKVTAAKKIFKAEDCDDDRQRYYWDKVKSPYIYVKGELFDDEDHPNAKAAAAILRNIHKSDCPLKVKASVEGGVISRGISDSAFLARTKIHSIALTFVPANQATLVEPLNLEKSQDEAADMVLIKSVMYLAETNVPSFRHITRTASAMKIENNLNKIAGMLGMEIPWELKQDLIQDSLKAKIEENVVRIHSLIKMQGYSLSHEHQPVGDGHITKIHAHTPGGEHIGAATFMHHPGGLKLSTIVVDDDHQRRGIGKAMLNHAQKITGKPVSSSTQQTTEGSALWNSFKPKTVKKALTAGYGGAGSPTGLVGGGVMQSQSMDTGSGKLRYITCDDCGKEQVYGKFQVKCREPGCGKAFPMAKLEKFFRLNK